VASPNARCAGGGRYRATHTPARVVLARVVLALVEPGSPVVVGHSRTGRFRPTATSEQPTHTGRGQPCRAAAVKSHTGTGHAHTYIVTHEL